MTHKPVGDDQPPATAGGTDLTQEHKVFGRRIASRKLLKSRSRRCLQTVHHDKAPVDFADRFTLLTPVINRGIADAFVKERAE